MQTTLRIKEDVYRAAKAEAALRGETMTLFIEEALRERIARSPREPLDPGAQARDRLIKALRRRTARFRIGPKPTREEMNAR
jgi:hypothetical protein